MARSIMGTIGLAATLVFALPAGMVGLSILLSGDQVTGGALIAVAILMVVVSQRVTSPDDLVGMAAQKTIGTVAKEPDDDEETG